MYKEVVHTLSEFTPRNTEALEWQIIDDVMMDNDVLAEVITAVKPSFFSDDTRRKFWNDIVAEFNDGDTIPGYTALSKQPAAVQTTYNAWKTDALQKFDRFGVTPNEVLRHIEILRVEAAHRRGYLAALSLLQLCNGPDTEAEFYGKAATCFASIEDDTLKTEYALGEVINEVAADVQRRADEYNEGRNPHICTGFPSLDSDLNGGFRRGNLIIIAARPGVGKTAVALQMARNAAAVGNPVAFFSIEMMRDEIGNRMLLSTDFVTVYEIFSGRMNWTAFEQGAAELERLPITVNDSARDLAEIVSRMTVLVRQDKCRIAFVDYLGLINPTDRRVPLYQQIAEITGTMKATAKRLGIPIVLLCQLNRDAAKGDEPPQLYHLRDSGSIEQDADVVLMLQTDAATNDLNLYVRKNRHGQNGREVHLRTNGTRSKYEDSETMNF